MSNKKFILKTFNNEFKKFIDFIIDIFPEKNELNTFNNLTSMLIKFNPTKLLYLWNYYITTPYYEVIKEGDYRYFENKNYASDVKDLKENAEYVLNTYNNMRESISKTTISNKKNSMKFIQNLSELSVLYYS